MRVEICLQFGFLDSQWSYRETVFHDNNNDHKILWLSCSIFRLKSCVFQTQKDLHSKRSHFSKLPILTLKKVQSFNFKDTDYFLHSKQNPMKVCPQVLDFWLIGD